MAEIPPINELEINRSGRRSTTAPSRSRQTEPFVAGPIAWWWIAAAARLPGRALEVAIYLHHLTRVRRQGEVVFNSGAGLLQSMGMSREAARRALRHLAAAGLVTTKPRAGRPPLVRLVLTRTDNNDGEPA